MKKFICGIIMGSLCTMAISSLANGVWDNINVLKNDISVVVDGEKIDADNFLYNDTTYLPLRAVSTALGEKVEYDENANIAYIGERRDNLNNMNKNIPPAEDIGHGVYEWGDTYEIETEYAAKQLKPYGITSYGYDNNTSEYIFYKDGQEICRCVASINGLHLSYDDLIDIIIPAIKSKLGL